MNATRSKIHKYLSLPYKMVVQKENDYYFAYVEELPGCMAHGDTEEEAIRELRRIMREWLEVAIESEYEIPLPDDFKKYSGRILLRLPKTLHKKLAHLAKKEEISLNQLITNLLTFALERWQAEKEYFEVLKTIKSLLYSKNI